MELIAGTTVFALKVGATELGIPIYSIEDKDKGMSVTNNAKGVIREIAACCGAIFDGAVIVYRDTCGLWDELVVTGGEFSEYRYNGGLTENEAISIAVAKRNVGV